MHIHFKNQVESKIFSEEHIQLECEDSRLEWKSPQKSLVATLKTLLEGGQEEEFLIRKWSENSGDLPMFFFLIETLKQKGWLSYTIYNQGRPFCTLHPFKGSHFRLKKAQPQNGEFQLSRFAFMRHQNGVFTCETPLSSAFFEFHDSKAAAILFALSKKTTLEGLKEAVPEVNCLESFLSCLYGASFLESHESALSTWEFHDLLFHSRTRRGRNPDSLGATFRFLDKKPPLAPIKDFPETANWTPLFIPDLAEVIQKDRPFTEVLETRKTIRDQGQRMITSKELGEFLYRSARVKQRRPAQNYEATTRPYPGGGACYELEIYPLINRAQDLDRGLYYYHPEKHALTQINTWNGDLDQMVFSAKLSSPRITEPQILLLLASRFGRVAWKYQSMAYATMLKDAGILMQTMYLVATAMDLAPCALGAGNSDLFSKVAKTNYFEETTIGEFLLGTKK